MVTLIHDTDRMNSLEIAELTGKRHDAILRDIRNLLRQGVSAHNFVETSYKDKSNRQSPCYNLSPKGCLILASGYDALLREKIINRLEELEMAKRNDYARVIQSYSDVIQLSSDQAKKIGQLQEENHQLLLERNSYLEKIEFADNIMQARNCITIADMANILCQNKIFSKGRNGLTYVSTKTKVVAPPIIHKILCGFFCISWNVCIFAVLQIIIYYAQGIFYAPKASIKIYREAVSVYHSLWRMIVCSKIGYGFSFLFIIK